MAINGTRVYGKYGWEKLTTSEKKRRLGTIMELPDGRLFKYARAGGTALEQGKLMQSVVPTGNHTNISVASAAAVGDREITVTLGATAVTEDEYADGYVWINDAAGEGAYYRIKSHPAANASASLTLTLEEDDTVVKALTTSSEASLFRNPYREVIIHPSPATSRVAGAAVVDVSADDFCWLQVSGLCAVLVDGALSIHEPVVPSNAVDGAVEAWAIADTSAVTLPLIGIAMEIAATTEHGLIFLNID